MTGDEGEDVRDDDELRETPPAVVAAVAAGCAPLPFLAVYAVLFIVHGEFHPVVPPDVTSTQHGELVVGLIALALLAVSVVALWWMLNGRRRWPFAIVQLAVLGTSIDFVLDDTKGGRPVSVVLVLASIVAVVCAFLPQSWEHVGRKVPSRPRRRSMPLGSSPAPDSVPTAERFVGDRDDAEDTSSV